MENLDTISGIVERVTFHSEETGWSVIKIKIYGQENPTTVTVHQTKLFPGATMEFTGTWTNHPRFGNQFKAVKAFEKKPATIGALERYIGSGLIYGVGRAIAKKIVTHFGNDTLDIFEHNIGRLEEVPGISANKLVKIRETWGEHKAIRDVMIFLQEYNISTLHAVKIYKKYGNDSISIVSNNPYRLANDIYGIGFKSADAVALNMGYGKESDERIKAAIIHILAAARDEGHCFLTKDQISKTTSSLLEQNFTDRVPELLDRLESEKSLMVRVRSYDNSITDHYDSSRTANMKSILFDDKANYSENSPLPNSKDIDSGNTITVEKCYYSKSLWFDENSVAKQTKRFIKTERIYSSEKINGLIDNIDKQQKFPLSRDQREAVEGMIGRGFAILTGGPGCGKTTTLNVFVKLCRAINKKVLLAAPTGRAAQRMSEVIGSDAVTIHRLLKFNPKDGKFSFNKENTLKSDILIIDETSMLDVTLTSALMEAVSIGTQIFFIGDVDQLPSVGAGNVLRDLIDSEVVPVYRLNTIFRQEKESLIIKYAHSINRGVFPNIDTPFRKASLWSEGCDCMFIDSDEATVDQSKFIARSKGVLNRLNENQERGVVIEGNENGDRKFKEIAVSDNRAVTNSISEDKAQDLMGSNTQSIYIPPKFLHVNPESLLNSPTHAEELKSVLKRVHPYSTLNYGLTSVTMIVKLYSEIIPKYLGAKSEVQILSPMTKGTLGTINLNNTIQQAVNPASSIKNEVQIGDKTFRVGDRVMQRRNNYDLEVFNGDIGKIKEINNSSLTVIIEYINSKESRDITYDRASLIDIDLAYAVTIHKSQGSEFDAVIIPLAPQHYNMLYRNLIYTGLTRSKKLSLFIGNRYSLKRAVDNQDNRKRQTMLKELLQS